MRHVFIKYEEKVYNSDFIFEIPIAKIKREYELRRDKNPYCLIFHCLRLDSRGYEHHWPFNFYINFNNRCKKELVMKGAPRAKTRVDYPIIFYLHKDEADKLHKNQFIPYDYLFDFYEIFTTDKNTVNMRVDYLANNKDKFSYVFGMDLVEYKDNVMDIIKDLPVIDTEEEILKKVCREKNTDIVFAKELISFLDLYSQKRKINILIARFVKSNVLIYT